MKAIVITKPGDADVLVEKEIPTPEPGHYEVRVKVKATAVNRADILQRKGHYPAPAGCLQDVCGLEFAGVIEKCGPGVNNFSLGDRVFGLVASGSYAEYVVTHSRALSLIPDNLTFTEAASFPEAFTTAYDAMVCQANLQSGERVLINAVGSGVGIAAAQIARLIGAYSIGTARNQSKLDYAKEHGLDHGILVSDGVFADAVNKQTANAGVDVVLELVGGNYLSEDLKAAVYKGRIIVVGLLAGAKVDLDLAALLKKRLLLKGTVMRSRPIEEKIILAQVFDRHILPHIKSGELKPAVCKVMKLADAAAAHRFVESNDSMGKVVLESV
jgi:putative PIG3 family NAD(P)H quinone oxidoreductase